MTVRFDLKTIKRATHTTFEETALYRDGVRIRPTKDGALGISLRIQQDMRHPLPEVYYQEERQTDCDVYVDGELRAKVRPALTEFFREECAHHVEDDICIKCGRQFMQYL